MVSHFLKSYKLHAAIFIAIMLMQQSFVLCSNSAQVAQSESNKFSHSYSAHLFNSKTARKLVQGNTIRWFCEDIPSFNELILSWNAFRPENGTYNFYVNVKHSKWSGWQKMATWGKQNGKLIQGSECPGSDPIKSRNMDPLVQTKHVRVEMQGKNKGKGFQVMVTAENGADIRDMKALYVCTTNLDNLVMKVPDMPLSSTYVPKVTPQSQKRVEHPRCMDLCSPTSASMVYWHFSQKFKIERPASNLKDLAAYFADNVHDHAFNIYGNWQFNVANLFHFGQGNYLCRAERLEDFTVLHKHLKNKIPVPVSLRGFLKGAYKSYDNGHYVVVVGYDHKKRSVLCLDPAFDHEDEMYKSYDLNEFITAWGKSKNMSYVVEPMGG